jgi:hypothetical protein
MVKTENDHIRFHLKQGGKFTSNAGQLATSRHRLHQAASSSLQQIEIKPQSQGQEQEQGPKKKQKVKQNGINFFAEFAAVVVIQVAKARP